MLGDFSFVDLSALATPVGFFQIVTEPSQSISKDRCFLISHARRMRSIVQKHVINLLQAALFNMILITYINIYTYIYYLLFIHTLLAMGDQPPTARHVTHHSTPAPLLPRSSHTGSTPFPASFVRGQHAQPSKSDKKRRGAAQQVKCFTDSSSCNLSNRQPTAYIYIPVWSLIG
jgi:hypothetical protein